MLMHISYFRHVYFMNQQLIFLFPPQLKSLLQTSVEKFVSIFDPVEYHRVPLFQMALTFDDEKIEIYPTLQDLEAAVLEILTTITTTLQVRSHFCSTSLPPINFVTRHYTLS